MKRLRIIAGAVLAILIVLDSAGASEFYAYYTRLDHDIPVAEIPEAEVDFGPVEPVLKVGDTADNFGRKLTGNIDDVRIYATALSASDIAALAKGLPVERDILAHYPFDNSARDSSGGCDNAELKGGTTFSSDAKQGSHSLQFDGGKNWVLLPVEHSFDTDFTWSAWIKTTGRGTVVSYCDDSGQWHPGGKSLFVLNGSLTFDVGWVGALETRTTVNDGDWHHVALTLEFDTDDEEDTAKIYIDGKLSGSKDDWDISGGGGGGDQEEESVEETTGRGITGKYADIVVNIDENRQFVFSRESSYLPYLQTKSGKWYVNEVVPRQIDVKCLYSYVRIVENEPDKVLVHWRYMPDLNNVGFAGVVHEYFTLTPDGTVTREIRQATSKVDEWLFTAQELELRPEGIKKLFLTGSRLESAPDVPRDGSPVKDAVVGTPLAWWRFDDGLTSGGDLAKEEVSGRSCPIDGNKSLWKKGVSGTALAFDGYHSRVSMAFPESPDRFSNQLTLEAWVALGAYPWDVAPVVHQSNPGGFTPKGYYLGIDDTGHPVLRICIDGEWETLVSSNAIELNRWAHIAGTFDGRSGEMRVYLDGAQTGELTDRRGRIVASPESILIGLNNTPARATHHVTEKIGDVRTKEGDQPWIFGIEGLIDEVKIYRQALSSEDILQSYNNVKPSPRLSHDPDIEPRVLPGHPGKAERFGAYYTKLKYHELWDNLWRTSDYPDIVVKFDELPVSAVYWRGPNYGPGWVTEKNLWMSDQSLEVGTWCGCSEHMSDKECRFAHVRLIENTDARVVVHWRYASVGIMYNFPNDRAWTDEYHTIYPDGVAVRKVYYRAGQGGWQDAQFLAAPGSRPEDVMNLQAVTAANTKGESFVLDWTDGIPRNRLRDACIQWINFKSDYKVYLIFPGDSGVGAWGDRERGDNFGIWAGPWNHWPVSQLPNDGRFAVATDRLTHSALGGGDTRGNMAIYGFTNDSAASLAPLARSWKSAPGLTDMEGCSDGEYKREERAYVLTSDGSSMSFGLDASDDSPVVNPCFVIKNWGNASAAASLKIDGEEQQSGQDFRQGIVIDTDGTPAMVIWIKRQSTRPTGFELTRG